MDMRPRARITLAGLLSGVLFAGFAPDAGASFGVASFEAGTCVNDTCTYESVEKNHAEAFTQAAGHPPWGMTTFELNHKKGLLADEPEGAPLKRVRVDVAPGLASNPQAPLDLTTHEKCSIKQFEETSLETGDANCPPGTEVGTDEATVVVGGLDVPVKGKVYNLEPEPE